MNLAALSALTFARPGWLLAMLPLAILLWRLWHVRDGSVAAWNKLIDANLLPHVLVLPSPRARRAGFALFAGGLLAAVLALAGPVREQSSQPAQGRGVTRVLVLDLSPGMAAQLAQVKLKILALLQGWPDGQTALIVYGDEPYLVVPPTTDTATIALFVPDLATDAIPVQGNRPARALSMAKAILARGTDQQREVFWITGGIDGDDPALAQAVQDLTPAHLTILHAAPRPAARLAALANRTGAALVPMRADNDDVHAMLDASGAGRQWRAAAHNSTEGGEELGYWLLLPLLPMAALGFRRGVLSLVLAVGAASLLAPPQAWASELPLPPMLADSHAWHLLQAGQAQAAAARFADPRWRAVAHYRAGEFEQAARMLASLPGAQAHYNRGNALARQGRLTDALAAYDAALKLRAGDADTIHNRDLVERLLKQQSPPPKGAAGRAPRPPADAPQKAGPASRAPAAPEPSRGAGSDAAREAERVAEQWLRRVPDQPGTLLRRKLQLEQRRREAGMTERPW